MPRSHWWKTTLSEQVSQVQNFAPKIGGYAEPLGWDERQVIAAVALCNHIIAAINVASQCRATMLAVTNWRDLVLYGEPKGTPSGKAPTFPVIDGSVYDRGLVDDFFDLRDQIVANNGYTLSMGEDLGIVGSEQQGLLPADTTPELKTVSANSNMVTITGSMQGLPVMRVEYAAKGQTYSSVAIITNLPAMIEIPMVNPNVPQLGTIRTIYLKNNTEFGNYSPNYDVTLA